MVFFEKNALKSYSTKTGSLIKLKILVMSIVKSRGIQRNIVQEHSLEKAGFRDYAEKLGAPITDIKMQI